MQQQAVGWVVPRCKLKQEPTEEYKPKPVSERSEAELKADEAYMNGFVRTITKYGMTIDDVEIDQENQTVNVKKHMGCKDRMNFLIDLHKATGGFD